MTDRAQFLRDVLVWPGEQSPGFINLHTTMQFDDGRTTIIGWPYKTLDEFWKRAAWITSGASSYRDVWMCMSQQSEKGTGKTGKDKALRSRNGATWLKAIWIDIDVKPVPPSWSDEHPGEPWVHYDTKAEALSALSRFVKKVGLPTPSVIDSGGGLHVYWVSDKPLTFDEWHPYADGLKALLLQEGLKCDAGLTTDAARLLRTPDTLNHKYDPPRPVALLRHGTTYSFTALLANLKNFKTSNMTHRAPVVGLSAISGAPDPAFAALNPLKDTLHAGIDLTQQPNLVDPTPIFEQCGFLKHAFETGGADFANPLWHQSVVCTAFMENGNALAHEISKGHGQYKQDETQAEFDRALADRAERGLGYPRCSTIKSLGSKACEGCPLFSKGKSPLNIRPVIATQSALPPTVTARKLDLPEEYGLDHVGRITFDAGKMVKGEWASDWIPIFKNTIYAADVFKHPDTVMMQVSKDMGTTQWVTFAAGDLYGQGVEKIVLDQGLLPATTGKNIGDFFMSFIDKMWRAKAVRPQAKYGWYHPDGSPIPEGFAYGGELFRTDGTSEPSSVNDSELVGRYSPCGTAQQWHTTASYIFRQKRPDFDAIIACAFGAPLMELTGTTGGILASMGERGAGKSYALEVAAAVWGDPRTTKESKTTTPKSLMNKMGKTNCLPAFWDEVSDPKVQQKFLDVLQDFSGGVEGGRLHQNVTQRERGTWCTIININGNKSFCQYIVSKQKDHGAGLRRVLEYWVKNGVPNPQGQASVPEAQKHRGLLNYHYGCVGRAYAEFLSLNYTKAVALLEANTAMLDGLVTATKEENMWLSLCACLLTGAELATQMQTPVDFDIPALKAFLIDVYLENRKNLATSAVSPNDKGYAAEFLIEYLKDRTVNTVWTLGSPQKRGRMSGGGIPSARRYPQIAMVGGCHVQFDQVNKLLHISRSNFENWCDAKEGKRTYSTFVKALVDHYGVVTPAPQRTLAAGTSDATGQERCFTINLAGHADLEEIMNSITVPVMGGTMQEAAE